MVKKKRSKFKLVRRFKHLKKDLPAVFLAMKNPGTPLLAKLLALVIVAYALSPIDLIPDFIPFIGYLDDIVILPLLMYFLIKLIPEGIWSDSQKQSETMWLNGKPKKWYYALPIIIFGILIILFISHFIRAQH
ncbi:YkvA family protein [Streptococcus hongkongensis]